MAIYQKTHTFVCLFVCGVIYFQYLRSKLLDCSARAWTTKLSPEVTSKPSWFEAVRCVCPWNDERDAKENDWSDESDQYSQKQLRNAMILVLRRQKPPTNALDGLYLPCVDSMLEAHWVEGCAVSLSRHTCVWWKSRQGFPSPTWCRFQPHGEVALHRMSLPGGENPQSLTLTLCSPDHFTMGWFTCLSEYDYSS